jgi:hypothetical protein
MPPATESDDEPHARRLLSVLLAVAAAVVVVVVVLAVLGAIDNNDADRRPQPVGTVPAPSMEVVADATDVERGVHLGLDGRVLTVQLLQNRINQTFETVSGARISATCGANVAAPPGDPRRETTLTRRWPDGQTSTSYRFPRDVSKWCRLEDQSGSILAFVRFPGPGVPPGARELITETANKWARLFASSPQTCADYMGRTACEQVTCQRVGGTRIPGCRAKRRRWAREWRGATVQKIAISGDRAAASFSSGHIPPGVALGVVQLKRIATGEWLIDRLGVDGAVGSVAARRTAP